MVARAKQLKNFVGGFATIPYIFADRVTLQSLRGYENHFESLSCDMKTHPLFLVGEKGYYY